MSAYVVDDKHIDAIVNFAICSKASFYFHPARIDITRSNAQEIGQILIDENYRSVNYRYRETDEPHSYQFTLARSPLAPVAVLKAINCLDYQCCETDDWQQSRAWAILDGIRNAAIRALPGYDTASWGIQATQ